jgi:DNA gyrase subunit A
MAELGTEVEIVEEDTNGNGSGLSPIVGDFDRVDYAEMMIDGGLEYATEVVGHRAIPDVRDGLIPVQRRIIFAMHDLNNRAGRPFLKSAKTVGHVIGEFHPHGDGAAYGAMVRLAQPWVMTCPMIEGLGNWGNASGDTAAAYRYTEARLSKIGTACCADIHPEIVRHQPNFTEKQLEATVLPMVFPALIVNGTFGIGFGFANNIAPHNLAESIDACILVADNPDASLKQIMKRLPGPDFPGGGILVNPQAIEEAYKTGRGKFIVRARYRIERRPNNQQAVIFYELPYGIRLTGEKNLIDQITKAVVIDGSVTEMTEDPPTDLSDSDGPKFEVLCKRGGNVQTLIAQLYDATSLQTTVGLNMVVLVDRYPHTIGMKEALSHFVDFRLDIVRKRFEREFRVKERELRKQLAYKAAVDVIDKVVQIIRSSSEDAESIAKLVKLLKFVPYGKKRAEAVTEQQARWIIEMQLRRLQKLNRFELDKVINDLTTRLDEIRAILDSPHGVRDVVKEELKEVKRVYGTPRKTAFGSGAASEGTAIADLADVPVEEVYTYISDAGMALSTPRKKLPAKAALQLGSSRLVAALAASSDQSLYAFSEQGQCYSISLYDVPVDSGKSKGRAAVALTRGDRVAAVVPVGAASHYLFVTEQGAVKRVAEETIQNAHAGGVAYFNVPAGDRVVAVLPHGEAGEALVSTAQGQALRFDLGKVSVVKSGGAGGVAGIKLKDGDHVVSVVAPQGDDLLVLHEHGFGKRVPLDEYPAKGRGTGGVASADPDKPVRGDGPAGEVIFTAAVPAHGDLTLFTATGQLVLITLEEVESSKRPTVSKAIRELKGADPVWGAVVG